MSCECRRGCPPYTSPLQSYFVSLTTLAGFPTGYTGRLMRFQFFEQTLKFCAFERVVPLDPFTQETLSLRQLTLVPPGQVGYQWTFFRAIGGMAGEQWQLDTFWTPPSPIPIDPNSATSCSRVIMILPQTSGGAGLLAKVEAAYPDACDHTDYPAKVQSPWHHDTPR